MTNYPEHRILGRKASSPTRRRQFLLTRTEVKILRSKKEDAASLPCLGIKVLTTSQAKGLRRNPWAITKISWRGTVLTIHYRNNHGY